MDEPYYEITKKNKKIIKETSLKKFTPTQRKRLKEMAKQIQSELEVR